MEQLVTVAADLQSFFEEREWQFCFIGGFALQHWGESRLTEDVDLSLITGFGREEVYVSALLGRYESRIEDATAFAVANRVLLLRSSSGIGIDVALAGLPFEKRTTQRAVDVSYSDKTTLRICSAEDLVVHKAFANRDQDWIDIKGILVRQGEKLDKALILEELTPLVELKEDPAILERLKKLFDGVS